jgi:hypothetical protein
MMAVAVIDLTFTESINTHRGKHQLEDFTAISAPIKIKAHTNVATMLNTPEFRGCPGFCGCTWIQGLLWIQVMPGGSGRRGFPAGDTDLG